MTLRTPEVIKYEQVDERISKTREKKENLLLVLTMPEILLHNNVAELAARAKIRKRPRAFGTCMMHEKHLY
jgi:hypothetical protein